MRIQLKSFLAAALLVAAGVGAARGFPGWMGVYGDYETHDGANPGTYTILMNQDYWGLHAEVGIGIAGSWTTHAMDYMGNADGNSLWQFRPGEALAEGTAVQYYFHGWDDWGGNIYANNGGANYSFIAGPAAIDWIGASEQTPAAPAAGEDVRVWTQTWPRGAGQGGVALYSENGLWGGVPLSKAGTTNGNDLWRGNLGRFPAGTEVEWVTCVEDGAGTNHYDNNLGSNYAFTVAAGAPLAFFGGAYHWPTNGALTADDDLWLNVFASPSQTLVSAHADYAVNGWLWERAPLAFWQMDGTNEWWHADLETMPPSASVWYAFDALDGTGNAWTLPATGTPFLALVAGSDADADADGLPDDWETYWFASPSATTARANPDGDGLPSMPFDNWMECVAGTDPALSNAVAELPLLWKPSLPQQGGILLLSAAPEAFGGLTPPPDALTAAFADGTTATLALDSTGRWSGTAWLSATGTVCQVVSFSSGSLSDDNRGIGWTIPIQVLPAGEEADSDGDGMPDQWEVPHTLDPLADDASLDPDNDGISNLDEFFADLDPQTAEADIWWDFDGDGVPTLVERQRHTDPTDPDDVPEADLVLTPEPADWAELIASAVASNPAPYTIVRLEGGTYATNSGAVLSISASNLVLVGSAAPSNPTVLDGQWMGRCLSIFGNNVSLAKLRFVNGVGYTYYPGGAICADGVRNLLLSQCRIENCYSDSSHVPSSVPTRSIPVPWGAALYMGCTGGNAVLANTLVRGCGEGALFAAPEGGGALRLVNCTLVDNDTGPAFTGFSPLTIENGIIWNCGDVAANLPADAVVIDTCLEADPVCTNAVGVTTNPPGLLHGWRVDGTNSSNVLAHAASLLACDIEGDPRPALSALGADEWRDSDGDGMPDWWKSLHEFDPDDPADASDDPDGDGLDNFGEYRNATPPRTADADGDGLTDGEEVALGTNPLDCDTDGDDLSDGQELGTMSALAGEDFMWFDVSGGTNLLPGNDSIDHEKWYIPLPVNAIINNVCHTNACVCLDGIIHLVCPTNSDGTRYERCGYGNLSNTQWSESDTTVAVCNADLYARPSTWGSQLLCGSVESGGRTFGVVEYRNIGLYATRNTNELATFQLIIPSDETNTVYVSYLCASNAFREATLVAGIQCGGIPSCKTGERYYNLTWPTGQGFPPDGLTIKYSIGTGTNPRRTDTDEDGLSDSEEALVFCTNPLASDTDGDTIPDPLELSLGTSPILADTDGDGVPDGWELYYELDPLVADATLDLDHDGLSNRSEFILGTDPTEADSDSDGIADRDELGWWEYASPLPVFSYSDVTNLLSDSLEYDNDNFLVPLPFEVRFAGYRATKALLSVNGFVWFVTEFGEIPTSSDYRNRDLSSAVRSPCHGFVAAYWDDLKACSGRDAQLSVADAYAGAQRYCVIQYQNISINGNSSQMGSFRIVIPEYETNTVYVAYDTLAAGFDGSSATIGAQSPNRGCNFPVAYEESGSVSNGMVIAYHFGTGSNPLMTDTDGDGLEDGEEFEMGTSPSSVETDGDGLPDSWECQHGLDPVSPVGGDGTDGDPDGDHLSNAKELAYGTDPFSSDTDADGLPDGGETGCIFVTNAVPWMTFDESEDITAALLSTNNRCVNWPVPMAMAMQGETVSNMTISANGLLFFNRAGYVNNGNSTSGEKFSHPVCTNALVIAPYLENTYFRTNIPGRETTVKVGTATHGGEGFILVEFNNAFSDTSTLSTNAISFQVSVPTNHPDRAHVLYKDLLGQSMTGDKASIGMQTFGGRWLHSYCYRKAGKVWENLCLEFRFGANADPLVPDMDGDGVSDGQEALIGTSPAKADTDGDGLPDGWEVQNNLDPLSATGDTGAFGDPDGDGVDNSAECTLGTDPHLADTDNDGLADGQEVVCVSFADPLPWLDVSVLTNLTETITNASSRVLSFDLPVPVFVQCETVTNITISTRGVVCFNRGGYNHPDTSHNPKNLLGNPVDTNAFVVVAYGKSLDLYDVDRPSGIMLGTAEHAGQGYLVIEYENMYQGRPSQTTNAISFQIAIPTGRVDRIGVRYADVIGPSMDGGDAIIGCQSFGAEDRVSYCQNERGKLHDGMGLSFLVGYGTDPLVADTDGDGIPDGLEVNTHRSNPKSPDTDADGLPDAQEAVLRTSLDNPDSDGDGLLDGWEVVNNFNPLSALGNNEADIDTDGDGLSNLQEQVAGSNPWNPDSDGDGLWDAAEVLTHHTNPLEVDTDGDGMTDKQETDANYEPLDPDMDRDGMSDGWEHSHGLDPRNSTGDDGADADPDHDGLSNLDEYLNGTNPHNPDSDGDGVPDGVEIANGSDPNRASDGGLAPPTDKFREIEFNIGGDFAAWEMTIEGLGPDDLRIRKISMVRPGAKNEKKVPLKMRKANTYRLSMRWLNCDGHHDEESPWYCWKAQLDGEPSSRSYPDYSNVRMDGNEVAVGHGWIADNEDGLLTTHVHECTIKENGAFGGGNVAGGLTAMLYVLDNPKLVPDYDRDGKINDEDTTKAEQQKILHFWINDDKDNVSKDGSYAESPRVDIPQAPSGLWEWDWWRTPDWNVSKVNGYRDLIDFTPVFMDVSVIQILPEKIRNKLKFKLRHDSEAVNVLWTGTSKSLVGQFQKGVVNCCGKELDEDSYNAKTEKVTSGGTVVPNALAAQMRSLATDKGVVFIEGREEDDGWLKLDIYYGDNNQKVVMGKMPLKLSPVEKMYRWINSRGQSGETEKFPSRLGEPENLPDNVTSDRHLVFVHGANVTQNGARGWASEIFKRMWQAGMTAKFTAVTWMSDQGWDWNYHENVSNAFFTASVITQQINELPGTKVLMAHSLGNMVCSAMIQDYGLVPDCYFMCNSSVPAEAYDTTSTLRVPQLVHPDWEDYPMISWAARWHWLFRNKTNDDRKFLGWPGRFSNVAQYAFNFYSTGDEVLELATNNNVHTWTGISDSWGHYCWHKQELFKGRGGIGGTDWSGWNIEENIFGVNKISVAEAQTMSEADFRANTVFYCYPPSMNQPTIPLLLRGAHLAQGIPALTPAAGHVTFGGDLMQRRSFDCNIQIDRPNGWPTRSDYQGQWCHSDLKDIAYFYVFKFYKTIIEQGNLDEE